MAAYTAADYAKWGLTQSNNMLTDEGVSTRDESDFYPGVIAALQARGINPQGAFGDFGAVDVTPGWQVPGGDPNTMYYPIQGDLAKAYDWLPAEQLAALKGQMVNGMLPVQTVTALNQSSPYRYGQQSSSLDKLMQGLTLGVIGGGIGGAFGVGPFAQGGMFNPTTSGGIDGWSFLGDQAGAAGGTLPDSYWNMLAQNGGTMTDAGTGGAGMDDWYTELQNLIDNNGSWMPTSSTGGSIDGWGLGTDEAAGGLSAAESAGGASSGVLSNLAQLLGLSPSNLMKLLATGGGGILGALAGKNPNATTTQTDIPDWLKPYYTSGLGVGLNNLTNSQSLSPQETGIINNTVAGLTAPNAGLTAANQAMTDTASGKYLDLANNPQWQEAMRLLGQNYNETIRPGNDAQFSRAGAMGVGNSAWEEMNARNNRALATGQGAATAGAWGTERQNQMNAAGAMPGFQNQMLTGNANSALGLLGMPRNIANTGLQNYASLLSSTKGPVNQTQTTTANPWQTAAGGAMTGYALSNLWK